MDTITISDDEEADLSVQVICEYKPKQDIKLDEPFLDPPTPTLISGSPSPTLIPNSQSATQSSTSLSASFISSSQPPPIISDTPSPALVPNSQPQPLISESPTLISESPTSDRSSPTEVPTTSSRRPPQKKKASSSLPSPVVRVKKAAREELKQQKLREKEIERIHKEANRANTASKATQNCIAVVDKQILKLINDEEEAHFTTLFEESSLTYKTTEYPRLDNCVSWTFKRTEVENDNCVVKTIDTDLILVVMDASEYVKRILLFRDDPDNPQSLKKYICDIKQRYQSMIVVLVYNLNNYIRTERTKEAKNYQKKFKERFEGGTSNNNNDDDAASISNVGPNDLQELRLSLLIDLHHSQQDSKVHLEFREKTQEVVDSIVKYTKSVAGREIKKKERAATNLDWAINMDKEKAIDPTRSSEDLTRLWIAQLQQFSQITLPIAKTIAAEYPSPSALLDQYESLTASEAQDLLAELHVQRNLKRQVGQNISRRIYRFLTIEDPDIHIGFD